MKSNLKLIPQKPDSDDELIKELMKDPVVVAHCEELDKQGVQYQIIQIRRKQLSA